MDSLDDLLSKRRRGLLLPADEQRLSSAVRSSREYELALLAGDALERDGVARPGDAERIEELVAAVERRWWGGGALRDRVPRGLGLRDRVLRARWLRRVRPLVVVPLFFAGAAAASYGAYRAVVRLEASRTGHVLATGVPQRSPGRAPREAEARLAPVASMPPVEPPPVQAAPVSPEEPPVASATAKHRSRPARDLARAERGALATTRPAFDATDAAPLHPALHPAPHAAAPRVTLPEPATLPAPAPPSEVTMDAHPGSELAPALFRRANRLRRSDWSAAAAVYGELIERYPDSTEAGIAEVALGKWLLAQGRSGDALERFRAHQRRGGSPLAAEAIWGEARALESIGSHAAALEPWRRLVEQHPDSPYAVVARQRLRH
jgi:TolA-binding protein